jgi:hypothetical protein
VAILLRIACKFSLASSVVPKSDTVSVFDTAVSSNSSTDVVADDVTLNALVNKVDGTPIPNPLPEIPEGIGGNLADKPAREGVLVPIENPALERGTFLRRRARESL